MSAGSTNQLFKIDRNSCRAAEPDTTLNDEAFGRLRDEGDQISGPDDPRWNRACLEYFKAKYLQRLQGPNWRNGRAS